MSVICQVFCKMLVPHNHFKTSFPTSGLRLHYQSGPKPIISICGIVWNNVIRVEFCKYLHNNLKQVLCLCFLPEFQNANSIDPDLKLRFEKSFIRGEKWFNLLFIPFRRLMFIYRDVLGKITKFFTEEGSFISWGMAASCCFAPEGGCEGVKCQEVALFSADILNSDCLLCLGSVFVPPVMIGLQKIQWPIFGKSSKFWHPCLNFQTTLRGKKKKIYLEISSRKYLFIFWTLFLVFYWATTRRCFETGK